MIDVRVNTIFGANVGFEILSRQDFESIEHEALWSLMVNLLFFRVSIVKYPD